LTFKITNQAQSLQPSLTKQHLFYFLASLHLIKEE